MTKRLYYNDSKCQQFEALILERRETGGGVVVCLDQTAFYPTSGGQPHDTGTLNGIPVLDVWVGEDGRIWHRLAGSPDPGRVTGLIDWERRFDHMQQHSGQHILSAAFLELLQANTVGFHLGAEASTIDLDIPKLSSQAAQQVEDLANQVIWEDHKVTVRTITDDEIPTVPFRKVPQVTGHIRVVSIGDFDASACGGTHVGRTGEIGVIKIVSIERYKKGLRVTFLCGQRALRHYQRLHSTVHQVSVKLSIHPSELAEAVDRLVEDSTRSRRALRKTRKDLTLIEAERLWQESPETGGMRQVVAHWEDFSFEDVRLAATRLRQRPHTLVLLAATEGDRLRLVCARSDDLAAPEASAVLRRAATLLGGKGGGTAEIAQGGAPATDHAQVLAALQEALQQNAA